MKLFCENENQLKIKWTHGNWERERKSLANG